MDSIHVEPISFILFLSHTPSTQLLTLASHIPRRGGRESEGGSAQTDRKIIPHTPSDCGKETRPAYRHM